MKRRLPTAGLLLLVPLLFGSLSTCDTLSGTSPPPSPPASLEEALERWTTRDFDDYRFRFERSCFCSPTRLSATVLVRGDTVSAVDSVWANGAPIEETDHAFNPATVKTIDQLFDLIRAADQGRIDSVAVEYDAALGFPSSLFVDPLQAMADEEVTYSARAVHALDPRQGN